MKTITTKSSSGIARALSMGAITSVICLANVNAGQPHGGGTSRMHYDIAARFDRQQNHIAEGVGSGRLTASEAARIETHESTIQSQMRSDRHSDDGGKLTASQRRQLVRAQNRAADKIYELKRNQSKTASNNGNAQSQTVRGRFDREQKHVAEGIASGRLTAGEAARVETHEAKLQAQMRSDRRADNGGKLTPAQRHQLTREEERAAKKIHELENNQGTSG